MLGDEIKANIQRPPAPLPTTRTLIKLILSRAFGKIMTLPVKISSGV